MRRTIGFLGVVGLVLALAPAAHATSGTMYVSSDTTLTSDHYGSIVIEADDITLDCAGHAVIGPGERPAGISLESHTGVIVKNCSVYGFEAGIWLYLSSNVTLERNLTQGNAVFGFSLENVDHLVLVANRAMRNGDFELFEFGSGFGLAFATHLTMNRNTAIGNATNGFTLYQSDQNELTNNGARANQNSGFSVEYSSGNLLDSNQSVANVQDGFDVLSGSNDNSLTGNLACGNHVVDAYDDPSNEGNVWEDNHLCTSEI